MDAAHRHKSCLPTWEETTPEDAMNLSTWQGRWKQMRGSVAQTWGRLTGDRLLVFIGEQDAVNGRIQTRLGRVEASRAPRRGARILPFRR